MAARSRRRGSPRVTLIFLVLLSLTIITLDFRGEGGGVIERVRGTTADALSPVRRAADTVLTPVGDAFSGVTGYGSLRKENDQLRKQIAQLKGQQYAEANAQMERDQLLQLNGLQDQLGSYRRVTARVVSAPVANFEQTIELDVGSESGVGVDMLGGHRRRAGGSGGRGVWQSVGRAADHRPGFVGGRPSRHDG